MNPSTNPSTSTLLADSSTLNESPPTPPNLHEPQTISPTPPALHPQAISPPSVKKTPSSSPTSSSTPSADFSSHPPNPNAAASNDDEIRCPNCGKIHPNPPLADSYRNCWNCSTVTRQSEALNLALIPKAQGTLLIVAAAYGHPIDAKQAIDVRNILQTRVESYGDKDRLHIRGTENLLDLFAPAVKTGDGPPCPGVLKILRIRFIIAGRRSEVVLLEGRENYLKPPGLYIAVPKKPPMLILHSCSYGHPRGLVQGRGAFDVTERLQSRVEESGGSFLEILHSENLNEVFGDPMTNSRKNLIINYEIHGAIGTLKVGEIGGFLKEEINLSYTPIIAPLIVIEKATYGMTLEGKQDQIKSFTLELYHLTAIDQRKKLGLPVTARDNAKLRNSDGSSRITHLTSKLVAANSLTVGYIDVTRKVQERVEEHGGGQIDINSNEDLHALFGENPNQGYPKELRVAYTVLGHDSERMTTSDEITYPSGFPRNFIMPRGGVFVGDAVERSDGKVLLNVDANVVCQKVLSTLEVTQGMYGKLSNYKKVFDVTPELSQFSFEQGGNMLKIGTGDSLTDLFRDPARGCRKELKIAYTIRGFSGTLRIEETDGHLNSSIQLGYVSPLSTNPDYQQKSGEVGSGQGGAGGGIQAVKVLKSNLNLGKLDDDDGVGASQEALDSEEKERGGLVA